MPGLTLPEARILLALIEEPATAVGPWSGEPVAVRVVATPEPRHGGRVDDHPTDPACRFCGHGVRKITAGQRWSLVVWAYGPPLR
jgi:hypothetical protein